MTLNREPAYAAGYKKIHEFQTNAIANAVIWRVVTAVLDAIEEELSAGRVHLPTVWVISRHGRPVAVAATRARARRWLKIILTKPDAGVRADYVINQTSWEE